MTRYFLNKLDGIVRQIGSSKKDLNECLTATYQVGTEMVEIDGTLTEQPKLELVWEEITKEQADALNPPIQEPSEEEIAKQQRISYLENEMRELSYDFDQDKAGIYQPNLEEKKALYRKDYNELCELKGVVPKHEQGYNLL